MSWFDILDSHFHLIIFVIILLQFLLVYQFLLLVYRFSPQAKFAIRIFLYYLSMFMAGWFGAITTIPTYFQNRGGIWAMKTFQFFTFWLDVNVEVRGKEKLDCEGQIVIVSNHQSSLDVVGMAECWPERCTVMMKSLLKYVPGFNITSFLSNTIFVNRNHSGKAHETLDQAIKTMRKKNLKLWVFPEGTRSSVDNMLPFKKGAFIIAIKAQIPVVPVVFSSYMSFYSDEGKYFHDDGEIIAEVLDPIPTEGMTIHDAPGLAEHVRTIMMETFKSISKEAEEKRNLP